MTNEELDFQRAKEALHRSDDPQEAALIAARLARENWTPPEPVDPDLIAVLEFLSKRHPGSNYYHGETAKTDALPQTCLAAYKAGRERERERAEVLEARLSDLVERVTDNSKKYVVTGINTHEMISARVALAKYRGEA